MWSPERETAPLRAPGRAPRFPVAFRAIPQTPPDLLEWAAREARAGQPVFYWQSPGGERMAGSGQALLLQAFGRGRFEETRAALERFWKSAEFEDEESRKNARAFSAFSFWPEPRRGSPWKGVPPALAWVPRRLFRENPEGRSGTEALFPELFPEKPLGPVQFATPSILPQGWDKAGWNRDAAATINRIARGDFSKAVLIRHEAFPLGHAPEIPRLVGTLRSRYPQCFIYWVHLPHGDFIGASPELLVSSHGKSIQTIALAGSAPRGKTPEEDARLGSELLSSRKNAEEHALVVSHLRRTLEPLCSQFESDPSPRLLKLQTVQHLRTAISGILRRPLHVLDAAAALHPSPAVGGTPTGPALEWIRSVEPVERGWYAGPIGMSSPDGSGEFAVALRSAWITGKVAHLFAGCGLVAGSDPQAEWDETVWKLSALKSILEKESAS